MNVMLAIILIFLTVLGCFGLLFVFGWLTHQFIEIDDYLNKK